MSDPINGTNRMTLTQWLVCFIAVIGFAFDIYELLMLPLIVRPALQELIGALPGTPEFSHWVGLLFFVPAFAGGIFGLLGGWLAGLVGLSPTSWIGQIIVAVVGGVILVAIIRAIRK